MKKVLILSVTAGNGHNVAAKAVKEQLESTGEAEVRVIDVLKEWSTPICYWLADGGYNMVAGHLRPIFNAFFRMYGRAKPINRNRSKAHGMIIKACDKALKYIYDFQPDVIYATHFYAAILINNLRLAGYEIPCKVIGQTLDYGKIPFWECATELDKFAITTEELKSWALRLGYREQQLMCVPPPVGTKFYIPIDRMRARKNLGLDENRFTIMVQFGGGQIPGVKKVFRLVLKALKGKDVQIIRINGCNKRAFQNGERIKKDLPVGLSLCNVGYTEQIEQYIAASDLVIGKCGGMSSTELAAIGVPALVWDRMMEQEQENFYFFKRLGTVASFHSVKDLKATLHVMINNSDILRTMSAASHLVRKDGTSMIANWILAQPHAKYYAGNIAAVRYEDVINNVRQALKNNDKKLHRCYKFQKA